jgi:hypothetical protein
MAGTADDDLLNLLPAVGIANLGKETAATAQTLREAVNVDLSKEGRIERRVGRTRLVEGTGVHSLWADDKFPRGLYVEGDEIIALWPTGETTPIGNGLARGVPVSWALINDRVFWSNGVQSGLVTPDLDVLPWGPESPAGQPALEAIAAGGLDAGGYQVAITFRDMLGRESGTGVAAFVQVEQGGGIRLSGIPVPAPAAAITTVRIYRTGADDSSLRHVMDLPAGITTVAIGTGDRGKALDTQHHVAMPPGHIVRYGHGRQWVARGNELRWSPSMRYGLWSPGTARLRFSAEIDLIECVGDGTEGAGVFVAAGERTYWLSGANPDGFNQRIAYPHGAVPGSSMLVRGSAWGIETAELVAAWLARSGVFCTGVPGGSVLRMKEAEAVTGVGERGASLFREHNGLRQFLTSLSGRTDAPGLRVGDRVVARTLRHDE